MNDLANFRAAVETLPATEPGITDEARQAIIEHHRTMREVREYGRDNRDRIDAEWNALTEPPRTIAGHLASLSPERRAELEQEWQA